MKNNFKRVFALLLAVVMCVTCTLPVFASTGEAACPGKGATHSKDNCDYTFVGTVEATCDQKGYTKYQCNKCNTGFVDEIVANTCDVVIVAQKAATCLEEGYVDKHCNTHNKDLEREILPALSNADPKTHTWNNGELSEDETEMVYTCTVCSATKSEPVAPHTEHVWGDAVITVHPTCVLDGEAVIKCTNEKCDAQYTIPVLHTSTEVEPVHAWDLTEGKYVVVSEATCEAYAVLNVKCSACGETKDNYEYVDGGKAAHDFTVPVDATESDCTTNGNCAYYKCSVCETAVSINGTDEVTEAETKLPKTEHNWIDDPNKENVEAACGQDGKEYFICSVCGEEHEEIKLMPNDHVLRGPTRIEPTCEDKGLVVDYCVKCEKEIKGEYLPALGHHKAECTCTETSKVPCGMVEISRSSANCETSLTITYACTLCVDTNKTEGEEGYYKYTKTITEDVAPGQGAHNWEEKTVNSTCTTKGEKYSKCSICGVETEHEELPINPDAHVYGSEANLTDGKFIITTHPSCTTAGKAIRYCTKCGAKDMVEQVLPALGHQAPADFETNKAAYITNAAAVNCQTKAIYKYTCQRDNCGVEFTVEGEYGAHKLPANPVAAQAATCTDGGWDAYYVCEVAGCGQYFDANKAEIDGKPETDALDHDFVDVELVEPTCTTPVTYEQVKCQRTGCNYTDDKKDADGNKIAHYVDPTDFDSHDCAMIYLATDDRNRDGNCQYPMVKMYACAAAKDAAVEVGGKVVIAKGTTFAFVDDENYGLGHVATAPYMQETAAAVTGTCVLEGKSATYKCDYCDTTIGGDNLGYGEHAYSTLVPAVAPQCGVAGNDAYYTCTRAQCDSIFDENKNELESIPALAPLEHVLTTNTTSLTCTQDAKTTTKCTRTGCTYEVTTGFQAAPGHDWETIKTVGVRCSTPGYTHVKCANGDICDAEIPEYIYNYQYPTTHDMTVEKDCINGDKHYCQNTDCSYFTEDGTAVNGTYEYTDEARGMHKNANGDKLNCKDLGEEASRVCVDCGQTITMDAHEFIKVEVAATCEEDGYTVTTCAVCDYYNVTENKLAPAIGHDENLEWTVVDRATCWKAGLQKRFCKNGCGKVYAEEVIPKLDHVYENYTKVEDADIGKKGSEISYCKEGCGTSDTRDIPALNGIVFSYEFDNYVKSGCALVNSGMLAVTVKYTATNASVNAICLALEFNKNVLTYVEAVNGVYTGFNSELCEVGFNNDTGKVSVSARANSEFSETGKTNVTLNGEGVLCTLVFAINDLAADNTAVNLTVVAENAMQGSSVVNAANEKVAVKYGTPTTTKTTDLLGDVNNDGTVTDSDLVKLVDFLFAAEGEINYSAQADVDQDGDVDLNDYLLLKKFTIANITYSDMCTGNVA